MMFKNKGYGMMMESSEESMDKHWYERMDIVLADFGSDYDSSLIGDFRPAIIVSSTEYNRHSPVMTVLPLTRKLKGVDKDYHIFVDCLDCDGLNGSGVCLVEQITTVDRKQVRRKVAHVTDERLVMKLEKAVMKQLDLKGRSSGGGV